MLEHRHIIFHIDVVVLHDRLRAIDEIRLHIQFVCIFLLLGVHIAQMDVEYAVTLVIQIAVR